MTPDRGPGTRGGPGDPDAVVVGSGPNGLVAANLLADAGWSVVVLEAQDEPGGAVKSAEDVRPGWVHDTFSSFYPLAAASPTIQGLGLERHGLEWVRAPASVGHPLPGGRWAVVHPRPEDTAAALDRLHPGDGDAWLRVCALWDRVGADLLGALLTPFPPLRAGLRLGAKVPRLGGLAFARELLLPVRRLGDEWFGGEGPKLLLAGNAAHADIAMDAPGSGLLGLLLAMLGQSHGFPVPRGGAGRLTAALVARFESLGGEIRTGVRVNQVEVRSGRAVGVRLGDGEHIRATRAVVADVSAPALFGGLVPWSQLPDRLRRRMRSFEWDAGTVKIDWALSGPVPWASAPELTPGTVHLADSVGDLAIAGAQFASGRVPDRGLVILGQMAATDPTRAPRGSESLWAYLHVPQRRSRADQAHPEPVDEPRAELVAHQVEERIEEYAPGFRDRVLDRRVLGPAELERRNENLVGGAVNGGTAAIHQQLFWRPVPGWGRPETPVQGLYLASASAHPGGGVHGACGSNAARAALAHDRLERLTARRIRPVGPGPRLGRRQP